MKPPSEEEKTKIISGKSEHTFDTMADELEKKILEIFYAGKCEGDPTPAIHNTLLIVMLSSEEKTLSEIAKVMNIPEDMIALTQELFADMIDLARYIHMGTIIRTMEEYGINAIAALPLANKVVQEFIFRRIGEKQPKQT